MMSSKPPGAGDLAGGPPVVKTRLPKIAKSSRATGVWSRKISPAGVSYLKMDDEVRLSLILFIIVFTNKNCRKIHLL